MSVHRISVLVALVVSLPSAFANVRAGTYQGKDQAGQACEFTIHEATFENDMHHPLNERQPITGIKIGKFLPERAAWNLAHVQEVDAATGMIGFVHSQFREVVATKTGAAAMVLNIDETEAPGGHAPKDLVYFENNFRNSKLNFRLVCTLNPPPTTSNK